MRSKLPQKPRLLYQGQASIRIISSDGKVIYIDPYAGDGYDLPADLILMTHRHFDHCDTSMIRKRNPDCRVISWKEALAHGRHNSFDLGYVRIRSIEAGGNPLHSRRHCVGYVLEFPAGPQTIRVYVSGDTSRVPQMAQLASLHINYAFFCCDGVFNMGLKEAAECAARIGAKHNIPYHMSINEIFDRRIAEQFPAADRLILEAGEEIELEPAS
ncbi:MBL fold metallo-hydrolase [Catenisphaera adipataccumulans]|uniref:L-ascorbate metabolism protein UlaG (Beta-lactamase superfamily) n=1 Tax=Catenisphaera adipataccumulans TaxID=700500 RepID=A0A7W8FUK5_9FIRM|nr:MBL fold metallo-hydrolase [Catenisphaera adipataccumulans]MBB5182664.1 L-ascorbate metabolism protein UlaG (beta-lactamase superfamily) [Catenisphaera adipataccumulans]